MGDLRETSQRFARIHTGVQMLYSLFLERFEAGCSSLELSQVGIPQFSLQCPTFLNLLCLAGVTTMGFLSHCLSPAPMRIRAHHRHGSLVKSEPIFVLQTCVYSVAEFGGGW